MHASMAPNKSISKLLLESSDLKMVDTLEFVPGVEENMSMHHGRKIYNTWTPRKIIPSSDAIDVKIFTDHLKFLVDNDKAAHHHLCSCIAHVLAHPGRRLRHAVILGSRREGTGKSYLKSVFRGIIGQEHVMEIGTDQLKEQFNEWLQRSEIIFVEELMAGGRLDIVNRLKPMLSEDTIAIRKMRTDSYTAINPASFFCTTNHRDAVILDRDSRRFWVWFSDAAPKSAAYYKKLFKWSDENLSSIYRWAIEYDLKDFNPEAPPPKTKHFNEMVDQTAKPIQSYIFEQIVSEDWPFKCDLVTTSDLAMSIKEIPGMRGISTVKLGTTLKSIGCLSLGQKRLADGTKPRLWAVRNYEKWANASEKEISTTYRPPGRYNDKNLDF
jgi:hypothetical protein